jgi:two-component system NarL family sensor kinase
MRAVTDRPRPDGGDHRRRPPVLPAVIALTDAVLLLFSVGVWVAARVPFRDVTDAYLLGDAAIGTGFAVGGALITLRVRRNLIGWLMLVAGSLYLLATAVGTVVYARLADGDTGAGTRLLLGIFATVWFPAIAVLIPAAIQLFPTGRPANRFWAAWLVATVVGGIAATVSWVFGPHLFEDSGLADTRPLLTGGLPGWLDAAVDALQPLGVFILLGFLVPLFRLVRRPGEERTQVLWLVEAALVVLAINAPTTFLDVPPPLPLLSIPLIPLAMTAAVLKYRLYGITLVINRTLVYLVLTLSLLAGYLGVVYGLSRLISSTGAREVLATALVAVGFAPLRSLLQRLVDRLMFGLGADPYGALADLGRRLQTAMTPDRVLPTIATALTEALRLPYVLVRAGRPGAEPLRTVEVGAPTGPTTEFPLTHRGDQVGTLVVGAADRPHTPLTGHRRALLDDLVRQAGPAVHGVVLTEELDASRQRTIAALEDERTRIRRDLHDGLGPALTGVALESEAARTLVTADPPRAQALMTEISEQTRAALGEVRRLVYGLRPPSLDTLGLRPALESYVERLDRDGAGAAVQLDLPPDLPRLDPDVEVAAYRIVTEALANVVRHSGAATAQVRLWVEDRSLHLEVCDDGGTDDGWQPGVGLTSMRERTEQLGGGFAARGSPDGGRVSAWLPLVTAPAPT